MRQEDLAGRNRGAARGSWQTWAAAACLLLPMAPAWSVPAFARATGLPCATCHTLAFGPALTTFGRNFKLRGYTLRTRSTIPLSADVQASLTHTSSDLPRIAHFAANNNLAIDDVDLYLAGRITEHSGIFLQGTYDGIARQAAWGVLDARYARDVTLGGQDLLLGASLNNFPTVQDPWNTTAAWRFFFPTARFANGPGAFLQIDGAYALQSLGGTAYALLDEMLYLEAGGYRKLADRLQQDVGISHPQLEHALDGTAPYWRAALQHAIGSHYIAAGVFGMASHASAPDERPFGGDHYADIGYDATYQFASGVHGVNAYATYTHEQQRLFGTAALGGSADIANHLSEFDASLQYVYRQTWALQAGYLSTGGNTNHALYPPAPLFGSTAGNPDTRGYRLQLEMIPFGKADSLARPLLNLRLGVQYTGYWRFNGGGANYDGFGHAPRDNDTLFLFAWLAI